MPINNLTEIVTLTAGGGTFNLDVTSSSSIYIIQGTATLTSNWTIQPSGVDSAGMQYNFKYEANIVLDGNAINIFGVAIPTTLVDKSCDITCYFDGTDWEVNFLPDVLEVGIIPTTSVATGDVTFKDVFTSHTTANGNASPAVNIAFGTVNTYQPEFKVRDLKGESCLELKGHLQVTGVNETLITAATALKIITSDIAFPNANGVAKHVIHMDSGTQGITPIMLSSGIQNPYNTDDDIYIVIPASFLGTSINESYTLYIDVKIPY